MKAVVDICGTQYLISEGQEIVVNRLRSSDPTVFSQVLMTISDSDVTVGTPYLPGVSVQTEKTSDFKGDKIRTLKFKAKSRYRKTTGFRPALTRLKITSITTRKSVSEKSS